MNSDIRISTDFPTHPKTILLRDRLGLEAVWALISLWIFAAKHRPDGVLRGMTPDACRIACGYAGDINELLLVLKEPATRFLDGNTSEGWIVLHDWKEHNPWAAGAKERSENARKLAHLSWKARRNAPRSATGKALRDTTRNAPLLSPPLLSKKEESPDALRLSGLLADEILKNNPAHRDLLNGKRDVVVRRWASDIDRLVRVDKKQPKEVEQVIRFAQSDVFWIPNVMSGKKLREKYETLKMQMQNRGAGKGADRAPLSAAGQELKYL